MTQLSQLPTSIEAIDETFPVQGQDNPSAGFRNNFNAIKASFLVAAQEFNDIYNNPFQAPIASSTATGVIAIGTGLSVNSISGAVSVNTATTTATGAVRIGSGVSVDGNGIISVAVYSLPAADALTLGGIRLGQNLVSTGGVTDVVIPASNTTTLGGVIVGNNINVDSSGTISVTFPNAYTLTTATASALGGVIVGNNINVDSSGTISVTFPNAYTLTTATASALGGVKIGSNINAAGDGTISVTFPNAYVLTTATAIALGGIKLGDGLSATGDGTVSANWNGGHVTSSTNSTSTTTGAIVVDGGIGIGKDLHVGGAIYSNKPFVLPTFTQATLRTIANTQTGSMVFVSDAPFGGQPCYFNGNTWFTCNAQIPI
jgi:hypothetical protein